MFETQTNYYSISLIFLSSALKSHSFTDAMNKSSTGTFGVISSITDTLGTISQTFGDDITTHGPRPESFIEGIKQGARWYQIVNKQNDNSFEGTMKKMILPFSSVA